MKSTAFAVVGFIDSFLEPEFALINGRETETVSFEVITQDTLRFPAQTDATQIAFAKLRSVDRTSLYRCKGYFQHIEGHQVFIVEDLNLSSSVPSGKPRKDGDARETLRPRVDLEVARKAHKRAQPLPPVRELERRAEQDTRNLTKVECEALLAHYPENDIRHYALALYMSRAFRMPIPIAKNWVRCRAGHTFSVGTPGMLFRNRKTYCRDCGRDVSVERVPAPVRTKEQRIHDTERATAALDLLKKGGWKARD